jgi:hypothetical protein
MSNDSNYTPVNPMGVFPNWIFCPKIVPLVYDDSLSYYEFLNKLMVKLNEVITFANQINANVEYLREIVERIQTLIDGFDTRITANEQDIANLKTAMESVNTIIEGINSTLTDMQADIDANSGAIENLAQDVEREINSAIVPLQDSVMSLSLTVANNTSRITTLEQAAFDPSSIVMSNMPFNFALSTLNGNKNGIRIVQDEAVSARNSIEWVDGGHYAPTNIPTKQRFNSSFKIPMIRNSGNACHIVIPSVFPIKYSANVNWTLYFYANRWIGATSGNTGINKQGPINFTDLLAEGGVQIAPTSNNELFIDMELFANQETGCYDLYLYNGRNNYSTASDYKFSSIMILPIDLGTMTQASGIQKYFNLLNTYLTQTNSNIDGRITSAVNTALIPVNEDISDLESDVLRSLKAGDIDDMSFTSVTGVSVVSNHSYAINKVYSDEATGAHLVSLYFIDLVLDVSNLASNTATPIGAFDWSLYPVTGSRSAEVSVESPNNGAWGSISTTGAITIKAFAVSSFGTTTRVRVTGTIADNHVVTP